MEASDWLKAQLRHLLPLYYKLLVKLALCSRCVYCHYSLWAEFKYFVQILSSIFFISKKWNLIQITNESQFIGWKWHKLVFEQKFDNLKQIFTAFKGKNAS